MIAIYLSSNSRSDIKSIYTDKSLSYETLWNIIKTEIKKLQNNNDLFYETLYSSLINLNEFSAFSTNDYLDYCCYITYDDEKISFKCRYIGHDHNDLIAYKNIYLLNKQNDGNCVDDFIKRGIESRVDIINNLISNIKSRLNIRSSLNAYHQSGCYENDFTDICLIKEQAEKIVKNCNKQLEALSDKYTNL